MHVQRETLRYSKSQIDKAADVWRRWTGATDVRNFDFNELEDALGKVDHYRACHAYPLQKATMGLRSTVSTFGAPLQISQRLKRFQTILDKLHREPKMNLSRMQDIGGCRAILPDIATLRKVQKRLERRNGYIRAYDYIETPRASGYLQYRGIHVILAYDERQIEVQLRTPVMHDWSIAVERFAGRSQEDLKSGEGSADLLLFLKKVSEAMALQENRHPVPVDLLAEVTRLRGVVVTYMSTKEGNV